MKVIRVSLAEQSCPIIIQQGLINKTGKYLKSLIDKSPLSRFIIITDRNVASCYLNKVILSLKKEGLKSIQIILSPGERQKSLETAKRLYDFLIKNEIERNDIIIALGGGVIGDVAGFVAGTYKRGLRLVHIPTSLIAQIDSSIGGKTAVNLSAGKNLIGVFYQPETILVDPLVLKTLPKREFYNGMAEVIKTAVIGDAKLFRLLVENHAKIIKLDPATLEIILSRCIKIKAAIVEMDEKDNKGKRILLNYGHTIGHMLE
ncbi:MAG: 3-dehydroquinate synthase family protein, partial [Planctomycetota bacterium]|nr:3-dehydroquinate synthase family protein [Planctomycetota bacterium]